MKLKKFTEMINEFKKGDILEVKTRNYMDQNLAFDSPFIVVGAYLGVEGVSQSTRLVIEISSDTKREIGVNRIVEINKNGTQRHGKDSRDQVPNVL